MLVNVLNFTLFTPYAYSYLLLNNDFPNISFRILAFLSLLLRSTLTDIQTTIISSKSSTKYNHRSWQTCPDRVKQIINDIEGQMLSKIYLCEFHMVFLSPIESKRKNMSYGFTPTYFLLYKFTLAKRTFTVHFLFPFILKIHLLFFW